jgi:carbonic anhydrase
MDHLIEGYRRFRAEVWPQQRERFRALAEEQRPDTLVIACSDSRVDPSLVFGAAPGELFVVRNVAGLVPPYQPDGGRHGVSAALEFGVRVLGVSRIVVLGHARCGGVQALLQGAPEQARDFVEPWMSIAESAVGKAACPTGDSAEQDSCEMEVVRLSLANLLSFPWIAEPVRSGALSIHGARFDILTGVLWRMGADGEFRAVDGP